MLARGIRGNWWHREQSNNGGGEYHLSLNARGHPVPHYALRKIQSREDICFKILPHQINGNLGHGSPLADASVVHQNVELQFECMCHVVLVEQVELLDAQCFEAERTCFFPQRCHLWRGLNSCYYVVPFLRQSQSGSFTKS